MNEKPFARIFFTCLILILLYIPLHAQTGSPATPDEDSFIAPAADPVPFTGGVMIGDVRMEAGSDEKPVFIMDGATGFILPQDHDGGVLTLSFLQTPEQAVQAEFQQFPYSLAPANISIDEKQVEIQIAPGQVYLFMNVENSAEILLDVIAFRLNAVMSNPETCGCVQVHVTSETRINETDIAVQFLY